MMFNKYRVKHKSRFIIFTVVLILLVMSAFNRKNPVLSMPAVHQQMFMRQLLFSLVIHFGVSLRNIWTIPKIFANSYMRSRN